MEGNKVNTQHMRSNWENIYKNYAGLDPVNRYIYSKLIETLEQYVGEDDSILEAGCGSGFMVSHFQQKGHYSVGLDLHEQPLRIAKEVFGVKHVAKGDIFHLPFEASSFDIVWNEGVLEHFPIEQSIKAAQEMRRVASKYVIIDVPNRYTLWIIRKHLMRLVGRWRYGYEESYSQKRLSFLMEQAGLRVIGVHGVYVPPPLALWGKWKVLPLLFFTIPLPERVLLSVLQKFSKFEDRHQTLTRMFGFHLIMIGEVNKDTNQEGR